MFHKFRDWTQSGGGGRLGSTGPNQGGGGLGSTSKIASATADDINDHIFT